MFKSFLSCCCMKEKKEKKKKKKDDKKSDPKQEEEQFTFYPANHQPQTDHHPKPHPQSTNLEKFKFYFRNSFYLQQSYFPFTPSYTAISFYVFRGFLLLPGNIWLN